MGLKDFLIEWIFKNVRVKKTSVLQSIDRIDTNADGYIDVGEFIEYLKLLKEWTS